MFKFKCEQCGKLFNLKTDLKRHINKKNPCIFIENLKEYPTQNIINIKKDNFIIEKNIINKNNDEEEMYNIELTRINNELKTELYLYIFNNLEKNNKFKNLYDDTVNKIFNKFMFLCKKKIIKNGDKEEYKREFELFDNGKIKSNETIKNKLFDIFNDNNIYFSKRLLKYAKNIILEIYDVKYIDLEDD
jgi:hypothetical protein